MWHSIGEVLVAQSILGALGQFAFIVVIGLVTIYSILRMRHETVVILSHSRLVILTVLSSVVCLGVYQLVLLIGPAERWSKGWAFASLFPALLVARYLTMILVGVIGGGRTIRDTTADAGKLFNCNWPLISRCTNQSLLYLCIVYLIVKDAWEPK